MIHHAIDTQKRESETHQHRQLVQPAIAVVLLRASSVHGEEEKDFVCRIGIRKIPQTVRVYGDETTSSAWLWHYGDQFSGAIASSQSRAIHIEFHGRQLCTLRNLISTLINLFLSKHLSN
jgi:hypothetical protein